MIGELFNSLVDELFEHDAENKRIGGAFYLAAKAQTGLALMTSPTPAPAVTQPQPTPF